MYIARTKTKRPPYGLGYVVIPTDLDRDVYIRRVYESGKCIIRTQRGEIINDCFVPKNLIQDLEFPTNFEGSNLFANGSLVCWTCDDDNHVFILNTYQKLHQQHLYSENTYNTTRRNIDSVISITDSVERFNTLRRIRVETSTISGEGGFEYVASDTENESCLQLKVNGESILNGDILNQITSIEKVELLIGPSETNEATGHIKLHLDGHTEIDDETEEETTHPLVEIEGFRIKHGVLANQQAAKGNTLVAKLEELIDAINAITVTTPTGLSGTPVNAETFNTIKDELVEILSTKNYLE